MTWEGDPLELYAALCPYLDQLEDADAAQQVTLNRLQRGAELPLGVVESVVVEITPVGG